VGQFSDGKFNSMEAIFLQFLPPQFLCKKKLAGETGYHLHKPHQSHRFDWNRETTEAALVSRSKWIEI